MTKLSAEQESVLRRLKHAWMAQSVAMQDLMTRQAQEREALSATMYEDVVRNTARALTANIPKRQIGLAVGTANYAANRKGLHADATSLGTVAVEPDVQGMETPAPVQAPVVVVKQTEPESKKEEKPILWDEVLTDEAVATRWVESLTFEHLDDNPVWGHRIAVTDTLGKLDEIYLDWEGNMSYYGETKGVAKRLYDREEYLAEVLKECVHNG